MSEELSKGGPTENARTNWQRLAWRWTWRGGLIFLLVAIIGHAIWIWRAGAEVESTIANLKSAGEPVSAFDLQQPALPDSENAVVELRAAAKLVGEFEDSREWRDISADIPLTPQEVNLIQQLMLGREEVFTLVDRAKQKRGFDWQIKPVVPWILVQLPDLNEQRHLASFIRYGAALSHFRGDHLASIRRADRVLYLSRAIDQMPGLLVSHLVAIGMSAMCSDLAIQISPDLKDVDRAAIKSLITQLLDESPQRQGYVRALQCERVSSFETIDTALHGGFQKPGNGAAATGFAVPTFEGYLRRPLIRGDQMMILTYLTDLIEHADVATLAEYDAVVQHADDVSKYVQQRSVHPFAAILLPSFRMLGRTQMRCFTDSRLAATALAIRLYAIDHQGDFPRTLNDLVPDYLPAVPRDPMTADNSPLKYRDSGNDSIVYSVGNNAIDDGGSTEFEKSQSSHLYRSRWNTLDAVVHLTPQPRDPLSLPQESK